MKINTNELEIKFLIDFLIGIIMFLGGLFFDFIFGGSTNFTFHRGFGYMQIAWSGLWGVYLIWTYIYWIVWRV